MKIVIYMNNFIYKYGGAEGYTANLIEVLQSIYKTETITIITESVKTSQKIRCHNFIENQNNAYGLKLDSNRINLKLINIPNTNVPEKGNKIVRIMGFIKRQNRFFKTQKLINHITKDYDLFINCSRYSFYGSAKKNIAIIHFPKDPLSSIPINNKIPYLKLKAKKQDEKFKNKIDLFIPNSDFTSYWLSQMWNIPDNKKITIYPPVTPVSVKNEKNHNQIFICSRIESTKKIDILIKAFASSKILSTKAKLIVAGSIKGESPEYINMLKDICPTVEFVYEPSRKKIEELYAQSNIFWHAKGINETNPLYYEHFGITTVEALSASCIPIVINKGGQKEIVNEICGFKWDSTEELIRYTEYLIENENVCDKLRKNCEKRSKMFLKGNFKMNLLNALKKI